MAVMAELLWRGWNVALPQVDVGEDVLVVKDDSGDLWRIQVKTATAQPQGDGYSAQFRVSLRQLRTPRTPDLVYIFAMRTLTGWEPFVVMDRSTLRLEHEIHGVGSVSADHVVFRLVSSRSSLQCSQRDFQPYRDDWSRWPVIQH